MNIRRSLLIIGGAGVISLILLGIFYATDQLHLVLYALIGLIVACGAAAAIFWTTRLERRAKRLDELDHLKSEFVSRVSHELRTPLTTIKALTRLLLRGEVSEEKQREYLETISIECDRQIDLILNLLDLSRIEGGVFRLALERVKVADVAASCVKAELAAAERRRHKLQVKPIGDLPPVCADPKALRRVVSNLIENSIKYTPDGGQITLSADTDTGYVALRVVDNGRGIPKEDLPILFDKFYRGRPAQHSGAAAAAATDEEFLEDADVSGVGLGLYLARDVMVRMGGRISVETEVGQGSTFTLHLPIWKADTCGQTVSEVRGNAKTIAGS
jgi:signal transduction histidine kinase